VQEYIGNGLPDSQSRDRSEWHETEVVVDPNDPGDTEEDGDESLHDVHPRAGQDEELYRRSNEAAPIEPDPRRIVRRAHIGSLRLGWGRVKRRMNQDLDECYRVRR